MIRKKTRQVMCGNVAIGGLDTITIQSMTTTYTKDIKSTVSQIHELEKAGCEIVRVAITDIEDAKAIANIKKQINIPIVADIHFDYKLALECLKNGIDKLRINPGNIGSIDNVRKIVELSKEKQIPIRIGVNSGSIEKEILKKYNGQVTAEGMVESALNHVKILEDLNFHNIVISVKASDVQMTVDACRLLSKKTDYPLHIGITESGTLIKGTIKSSIGIGSLLLDGIGDTIRVSLTDDPIKEVKIAREILNSLGIRKFGINLISCPTCGRCNVNLIELAKKVTKKLENIDKNITVAIMGCAVNGPGEAKEADIGLAGGHGEVVIFKKNKIIKKVPESEALNILIEEIKKL